MSNFLQMIILMVMLLNPFLLVIYLVEYMKNVEMKDFSKTVIYAGIISTSVFIGFAYAGEFIFQDIFQAKFESFQIFGGIVFLLISINFIFNGNSAISSLRGDSHNKIGAIAMPILIGPGSLNASVIIGKTLGGLDASIAIFISVCFSVTFLILLKIIHDIVLPRNARIIENYIDVMGRVTSIYLGTVSIQMILTGVNSWWVS